jgi:hypothetical protein
LEAAVNPLPDNSERGLKAIVSISQKHPAALRKIKKKAKLGTFNEILRRLLKR